MNKIIYLANPYGFSAMQKNDLLPKIINKLKSVDESIIVWEPFERNNQVDFSNPKWAYEVGQADISDVKNSDAIFAIVNGTPPDEGVMVELGIAITLNKKIFLFRDDFRRCTDSGEYPLNLMLFVSLPMRNWKDYYYTDINDIDNKNKAFYKWTKEEQNNE